MMCESGDHGMSGHPHPPPPTPPTTTKIIVIIIKYMHKRAIHFSQSLNAQSLCFVVADNPTYDTADSPKTANKYFDASNLVKQISGKSLTVSSNEQSRPNTPRRQTESRYLSLTVIATSEVSTCGVLFFFFFFAVEPLAPLHNHGGHVEPLPLVSVGA